jgi:hypothetical protein
MFTLGEIAKKKPFLRNREKCLIKTNKNRRCGRLTSFSNSRAIISRSSYDRSHIFTSSFFFSTYAFLCSAICKKEKEKKGLYKKKNTDSTSRFTFAF